MPQLYAHFQLSSRAARKELITEHRCTALWSSCGGMRKRLELRHTDAFQRMLEVHFGFPLLAFSIPDFAPDDRLPAVHPNGWSRMSNIGKSGVKNHLSPRVRPKIHRCQPKTEADGAVAHQKSRLAQTQ